MIQDPETMARIFQALSTATRVRLLCLLKDESLSVSDIADRLAVTQGAVSQHLRILRAAGLVRAERRGYQVHYHVLPSALDQCRQALECILERQVVRQAAEEHSHRRTGSKASRTPQT